MAIETIVLASESVAYIRESQPTFNYGGDSTQTKVGIDSGNQAQRGLIRFNVPRYSGSVVAQRLKLNIKSQVGALSDRIAAIHLVDSPQDDLWIQGTKNGAVPDYGCSWNEYAKGLDWDTAGGDFGDDPVVLDTFTSAFTGNRTIDIDTEILSFVSDKRYTLLIKIADEGVGGQNDFWYDPALFELELDIERDEAVAAPVVSVEVENSTELTPNWTKPEIEDYEFTKYELWQSDTGAFGGEQTLLATITDIDTLSFSHTGLVVQGDVDDFDPASDTYPNGRKKYYRITLFTIPFGNYDSNIADGTTIPAMRPVKFLFTPRSKFYEESFGVPNQTFQPYGVKIGFEWTDEDLTTELQYIAQTYYECHYKKTGAGWGSADETDTQDFGDDLTDAAQVEGDIGYVPYKIKGQVYDTGGLYRKATTDKSTEQFEITFPSPCPVMIPAGDQLSGAPPDLDYTPTDGGSILIDLLHAAQQDGDPIFDEDFSGTVTDKWLAKVFATGGGATAGVSYLTSPNRIRMRFQKQTAAIAVPAYLLKLADYDPTPANFWAPNIYKKYTGSIHFRSTMRFIHADGAYAAGQAAAFGLCGFNQYKSPLVLSIPSVPWGSAGYVFDLYRSSVGVKRQHPLHTLAVNSESLMSSDLGTDNPLAPAGDYGAYIYVEVWISPIFDTNGVKSGDRILYVYNKDPVEATAETFDWDTHSYVWVIDSINRSATDQINYSGVLSYAYFDTIAYKNCDLFVHRCELGDKLPQPFSLNIGYTVRNATKDEVFPYKAMTPTQFPLFCEPDQAGQTVYVEGRMLNNELAQSPTHDWSGIKGQTDFQGGVINNTDPIAFLTLAKIGYVGVQTVIDCSQSIDPEGGDLIYIIDRGDGSPVFETDNPTFGYAWGATGAYTVKLKVRDEAGNESAEVESVITIYDVLDDFELVELMSPWISISEGSPTGGGTTELAEVDYSVTQAMEGGSRVFNLTGIHSDPDCDKPEDERIAAAEAEKEYFQSLKTSGQLISLDLEFFGIVKGVIKDHRPQMGFDDQMAFGFSLTFQEVDTRQFTGA